MTLGQAVDEAIRRHGEIYPESEVYSADVGESWTRAGEIKVIVRAEHFSVPLNYYIKR